MVMKQVLVLGATGGVGGEVTRALLARGWRVDALVRDQASAAAKWGSDAAPNWTTGDAMKASDVTATASGASAIVHAVNPPGYRDWDRLVIPMFDNTLAAARKTKARVVLPGTIYNFGPDAFPIVSETSPQHPRTRKGAIRVRMEARLREATTEGVRGLVLRCGDFFGPRAGNSWFAQSFVTPGRPPAVVRDPGRRGVGHQWAYLPDVGETMARLIELDDRLGAFDSFGMAGHWDPDGTHMIAALEAAVGPPPATAIVSLGG
jgi:Nucleoside-diphosphate-sugar epimerases